MPPQQKRTFLPYERGINPENLRLGSLYLNPLDPDDGLESKRFEYQEDLEQDKYDEHIVSWIQREQRDERGCSLDFELSKESSLHLKFSDWVKAGGSADSTVTATLAGKSGRRLKIKKPEKFLREEVITQKGVQEWIRTQASIAFKGNFGRNKFKAPEIWMVTGVQLVTGGDVQVGSSRSTNGHFGAGGDAGAAFGAPPGVAAVSAEAGHGQNNEANNAYGYDDERVWAAQFMEVKIEYGYQEDKTLKVNEKPVPAVIATFKLEDIADLKARGVRASQEQRAQASGQTTAKPPKPIARIVVDEEDGGDASSEDFDGIHLDDQPYVEVLKDTNWAMHEEALQYLSEINTDEGLQVQKG